MNVFGKSGQHVGDNSSAIQVSGNVTFGTTVNEVINICSLIVKAEMASLRADAFQIANERAKEFGNQIASKLSTQLDERLKQKLADPDIQYSINQAVTQVARKGFNEKSELLKELIITKIETDDENVNILLDQALELTPKLTTNEIKFLSLIYYLRNVTKTANDINITEIAASNNTPPAEVNLTLEAIHLLLKEHYANYHLDYIKFLGEPSSIKSVNKDYLSMKGVVFSDKTYKLTYEQLLASRIGVESFKDADEFF
ncbi:hypothetical protein SM078_002383, partial [Cronobacter sakazakii]|nr:hypothetical protein [Cronobacter sakazakii]